MLASRRSCSPRQHHHHHCAAPKRWRRRRRRRNCSAVATCSIMSVSSEPQCPSHEHGHDGIGVELFLLHPCKRRVESCCTAKNAANPIQYHATYTPRTAGRQAGRQQYFDLPEHQTPHMQQLASASVQLTQDPTPWQARSKKALGIAISS
ncbi:hypothetical protein HDK77DRAFT_6426 [Phyllosticta capitalensis]